jgi:hypothetical protein
MATTKEKEVHSARVAEKLQRARDTIRKRIDKKNTDDAATDGGNGAASAAEVVLEEKVNTKEVLTKEPKAKKEPKSKKGTKRQTKKAAEAKAEDSTKVQVPAKKRRGKAAKTPKAPKASKAVAPAQQVQDPKVVSGLADIVRTKERDKKTGLTMFEHALVSLIERAGEEGITIRQLALRVWSREEIAKGMATVQPESGRPLDLIRNINNKVRMPCRRKYIERIGDGRYRFLTWDGISSKRRKA